MAINWAEADQQTSETAEPAKYYIPPGEYQAKIQKCVFEQTEWSDPDKPVLVLTFNVPSENAYIDDKLRLYAGALKVAASKIKSLGIDLTSLPADNVEEVAAIIDAVAKDNPCRIVCSDNNYNPDKPRTDVKYFTMTESVADTVSETAPF